MMAVIDGYAQCEEGSDEPSDRAPRVMEVVGSQDADCQKNADSDGWGEKLTFVYHFRLKRNSLFEAITSGREFRLLIYLVVVHELVAAH